MNNKTKMVMDLVKNKTDAKIQVLEGIKSAQVNALMNTIKQITCVKINLIIS